MYELTGICMLDAIRYGVLLHQSGEAKPGDQVNVVHAIVDGGDGEFVHAWAESRDPERRPNRSRASGDLPKPFDVLARLLRRLHPSRA